MNQSPMFDEALRRQREAFADRYEANDELRQYVDDLFGTTEEKSRDD